MLWKSENTWLPDNRQMAEVRLRSLKKLQHDDNFHQKYGDFMDNLINKRYARRVSAEETNRRCNFTWYLSHHAVFHPQKQDKLCVVFDAAAMKEYH